MKTLLILLGAGGVAYWQRKRIAAYIASHAASAAGNVFTSVGTKASDGFVQLVN